MVFVGRLRASLRFKSAQLTMARPVQPSRLECDNFRTAAIP